MKLTDLQNSRNKKKNNTNIYIIKKIYRILKKRSSVNFSI